MNVKPLFMDFGRRRGEATATRLLGHECTDACQRVSGDGVFAGLWVHSDKRIPKGHIAIDGVILRLPGTMQEER